MTTDSPYFGTERVAEQSNILEEGTTLLTHCICTRRWTSGTKFVIQREVRCQLFITRQA